MQDGTEYVILTIVFFVTGVFFHLLFNLVERGNEWGFAGAGILAFLCALGVLKLIRDDDD